jgi:aminoglycoside 3-N-acetyltransferase
MLSKKYLIKQLKNIKIKEKYIIIHSDVTGIIFKNFSLKLLWEIIFECLGKDKTYIFPTFTFAIKNKTWDYNLSKSECGILSEYFRKNIATRRTVHPLHSVSIFGKNSFKIPEHNSKSSFGKGSLWEWLCTSREVCNIGLGLNLHGAGTFCHYSEEKSRVEYRKYKKINVNIIGKNKNIIKKKFSYFARSLKTINLKNHWNRCEKDLLENNLMEQFIFTKNNYKIIKMNTFQVTNFILKRLENDPEYLIRA